MNIVKIMSYILIVIAYIYATIMPPLIEKKSINIKPHVFGFVALSCSLVILWAEV